MRSVGGLWARIVSWENCIEAAHRAARGKREKTATRQFFLNLEQNIASMLEDLRSGRARFGEYTRFIIHDPKQREIAAPCFRERVLHHALMNHCAPVIDRRLIYDTYACREGKGQHAAVKRAMIFASNHDYFLKMDIRGFFGNIDHDILYGQLARIFREQALLDVFANILKSYETAPGQGLPIGSLTSQYFANSYLSLLDRFVKEKLRRRAYIRYMDDFVVWGATGEELTQVLFSIDDFLCRQLKLELKGISFVNRTSMGMDFLGYRIFPGWIKLGKRARKRFSGKITSLANAYQNTALTERELQQRLEALLAFTAFARSWHFRRKVLSKISGKF